MNRMNTTSVNLSIAERAETHTLQSGIHSSFLLRKLSDFFIVLGFTVYIGGGVQLLVMLRGAEGFSTLEGDLPSQIIYLMVYAFTIFFLILSRRRLSFGKTSNFWFWLLLFWTCISVFWSGAPGVTIRQAIALCGTTFFSLYLVNNLDIQKYVRLLTISLFVVIISSYLMIFLFPGIGITQSASGAWKGIFTHKNHLGKAASLAVLVFSYLILTAKKGKWIWIFGLFSSVGLVIGCQSAAAMMVSLCIVMVILFFYLAKKAPFLIWTTVLGSVILLILIPLPSIGQILGYFGKEETLTGRTPLWEFCIFMAQKKPLLGYGYGAFWLGSEGPSGEVWNEVNMGTEANHCHNGFLDVALGVGGIGLSMLFILCVEGITISSKFLFSRRVRFQDSIYLIILLWILPYNISEQALLYRNNIFWVLFSSTLLYLHAAKRVLVRSRKEGPMFE